jgi:hypothetical protein
MQISDTTLQLQPQATNRADKLLQNLRPGQVLQATTLSSTQNGTLQVQIGRTVLIAQSNITLPAGTALTLNVSKGGELPQLQIVTSLTPKQLLQQSAASALPRQQPLQPLFQNLTALLASGDPLPPPFKALSSHFIQSILASNDPKFSQNFKAAVERSGPFLEAHLAKGEVPKQDLKATLIKMIQLLKPLLENSGQMQNGKLTTATSTTTQAPLLATSTTHSTAPLAAEAARLLNPTIKSDPLLQLSGKQPPMAVATGKVEAPPPNPLLQQLVDLFKHLEGALARVQLHQTATLLSEESNKMVWQLELPIRHADRTDTFDMRIEGQKRASSGDDVSHDWRLTIKFDLKPLGPMHANLTLKGGDELSTIFWAKQQKTLSLLNRYLPLLRSNLERTGFKVGRIEAYHGVVPEADQPTWRSTLLDEKA